MKTSIQTLQTGLLMLILGIITKEKFLSGAWFILAIIFFVGAGIEGIRELINRKDKEKGRKK